MDDTTEILTDSEILGFAKHGTPGAKAMAEELIKARVTLAQWNHMHDICKETLEGRPDEFLPMVCSRVKAERDAVTAKLAALVAACSTWQEWGGHCDTCEFVRQRAANPILDTALFADYCDCGWHATREALAAAKVPPDLDQLAR